mmetsp:Transcript_26382/g.46459  ORF Transcript_26382/g.46459 Transcript_26382/m.46459 type:complete len:271 (-) Transcript_26382:49-861(-)
MGQLGCSTGNSCASDFGRQYHMNIVKVDRSLVEAAAVAAAAAKADAEQRHWQEEWLRRGLAELEQQREAAMAQRRGSSSSSPTPNRPRRGSEQNGAAGFVNQQMPTQQSPMRSGQQSSTRSRSGSCDSRANEMFGRPGYEPASGEPRPVEEMPDAAIEQLPGTAFPETFTHLSEGLTSPQEPLSATAPQAPGADALDSNGIAAVGTASGSRAESRTGSKEGSLPSSPMYASEHGLRASNATFQEAPAVPALPAKGSGVSRSNSRGLYNTR